MSDIFERACAGAGWDVAEDHAVIGLDEGRSQTVRKEVVEEAGEVILRIYSPVGDADGLDPHRLRSALGVNYGLRFGALAIRKEQLVMVDTFLMREADLDEVTQSIKYLAKMADRYEKMIYGGDAQ